MVVDLDSPYTCTQSGEGDGPKYVCFALNCLSRLDWCWEGWAWLADGCGVSRVSTACATDLCSPSGAFRATTTLPKWTIREQLVAGTLTTHAQLSGRTAVSTLGNVDRACIPSFTTLYSGVTASCFFHLEHLHFLNQHNLENFALLRRPRWPFDAVAPAGTKGLRGPVYPVGPRHEPICFHAPPGDPKRSQQKPRGWRRG